MLNYEEKARNAERALKHVETMNSLFFDEIEHSVQNTRHYMGYDTFKNNNKIVREKPVDIILEKCGTTEAIWKYDREDGVVAALNFASYKNPGGKYMSGSIAQEEVLCSESTLYNVLSQFNDEFYKPNRDRLHLALYNDNLLYSKDITFVKDDYSSFCNCDVITCAAPNFRASHKYFNTSRTDCFKILDSRIRYIYDVATREEVSTLILGAWGCGVFGCFPKDVFMLQLNHLFTEFYYNFNKVIFAVPKDKGCNFKVYQDVYERYIESGLMTPETASDIFKSETANLI